MLDDRSYMRAPSFERQRSVTFIIIATNIVVFIIQSLLEFWSPKWNTWFDNHFVLSLAGLKKGYIWQLVTFQFLHGGPLHIILNLIGVYFFGSAMEEVLGRKGLWKLYLGSGAMGGLVQMTLSLLASKYFGEQVIGASAGVLGLVAAFATMFPERQITLLLFFVIPLSIRARVLFWGTLALTVFGIVIPSKEIAQGAHLGGLLAGWAYIMVFVRGQGWDFSWPAAFRRKPAPPPREFVAAVPAKKAFWQRPKVAESEDLPPAEFISREVDPILDKISAHGIQSLTEQERKILEAARAKMAKR